VIAQRDPGQTTIGIQRDRSPDGLEHEDVFDTVGVRKRVLQVGAHLLGIARKGIGLGRPPQSGRGQFAGEHAVDDFGLGAQHVFDVEIFGDVHGLERSRRRGHHDRVAGSPVRRQ
jgi:hypothetical protein